VFAVLRTSLEGDQQILTMTNVRSKPAELDIDFMEIGFQETRCRDLLSTREFDLSSGKLSLNLKPYEIIWLKGLTVY